VIIALDPGLRTGWAKSDGSSGVVDLSIYDDHGRALAAFHDWLDEQMQDRPSLVAIEQHFMSRKDQNASLTEWLCGIANMLCWTYDVPRCERAATKVRKDLTGNAKAKDADVIPAVIARGFRPQTEHAADACALLCVVAGIPIIGVAA
jgi:Holliday junction resolvasome RuvABC endonuclease subunit